MRWYFEDFVTTYGKTFHNWQVDKHNFPYDVPQLLMGFTEDGQAHDAMIQDRDRRLGLSTMQRRHNRADISMPTVVTGANSWESGPTVQTRLEEMNSGADLPVHGRVSFLHRGTGLLKWLAQSHLVRRLRHTLLVRHAAMMDGQRGFRLGPYACCGIRA